MGEVLKYGATAKWLHWLIGFIVIIMLIFGRTLESLPNSEREQMIMGHSGLGTLVLLLMLLRWGWRLSHEPPGATGSMGVWQTRLSKAMHWSFYILLVLQPVLGISQAMFITDYEVVAFGAIDYSGLATANSGMARIFHVLHSINATVLSVLVIGHILAALYHHFHQKDSVLKRMLPYGKVQ
jgi:cytochrome b561